MHWTHLSSVNPRGHDDVLQFQNAGRGNMKIVGHFDDGIGLRNPPAGDKWSGAGDVFQDGLGGEPGRTRAASVAISFGERERSFENFPMCGSANHGRHFLQKHRLLHGFGPGPGFVVGEQRERGRLAGAMATLATLLQYGQNVLGKSHRRLSSGDMETETEANSSPEKTGPRRIKPL